MMKQRTWLVKMLSSDPTFLGAVENVSGANITVRLAPSVASGFSIIDGRTYKVGQVGSFVRIPQGYQSIFGVVSEVGASDADSVDSTGISKTGRIIRLSLVGETVGGVFERGISQYPNIGDAVHLATEEALMSVYGGKNTDKINIGSLSSSESIPATLSLNALVTKHSAVLGSTGSGKSTTIASLIRSIVAPNDGESVYPNARVLMLDIHGEYSQALSDVANVLSVQPREGESSLHLPYWALNTSDLLKFLTGGVSGSGETAFNDSIKEKKMAACITGNFPGVETNSMTLDTPLPFSLKQLWFDLISEEIATFKTKDYDEKAIQGVGNAEQLEPPSYEPIGAGSAAPFKNLKAAKIQKQLENMRSRLLDRRYDFLLHPGEWEPKLDGEIDKDLDSLLDSWIGGDKPVTILDLSAVPSTILELLIGTILKIIYEALYWAREKPEGGIQRPLLVVMEEAHRYLTSEGSKNAVSITQRIAKEGRKYGIGCMVVSQRPSEVDETILSQCSTYFALRLTNPNDRSRVKGNLPDGLASMLDILPVLRTGEAVIMGEAAKLPMRCKITLPAPEHQPKSKDPNVANAWSKEDIANDYSSVVAAWRSQNSSFVITSDEENE